jgi:hypothetical protein
VRLAALPPGSAAGRALVLALFAVALAAPAGMLTALAAELRCSRPARLQAEAIVHPRRRRRRQRLARATSSQLRGIAVIVALLVVLVIALPMFVNSVAYAAGFGGPATFTPLSRGRQCTRNSHSSGQTCIDVAYGTLTSAGHTTRATYEGTPPLGVPFTVRRPVWAGWSGQPRLVDGGLAVPWTALALVLTYGCEGLVVLALWNRRVSREAAAEAGRLTGVTAGPGPEPGT